MNLLASTLLLILSALDEPAWKTIAPFFKPPAEFAGELGSYRSPLVFKDGMRVRSADDWQRRRKELLDDWMALMGPWPAIIEKPKLEVLANEEKDGLASKHVRLEFAPKQ